jgi:hypothetical protein
LQISNDRESKTLSIILQCDSNLLPKEQRQELNKFIRAIQKELEIYKKENGIFHDCIKIIHDKNGNAISLQVKLTNLDLYDGFIQRLANNLVPSANQELGDEKTRGVTPFDIKSKSSKSIQDKLQHNKENPVSEDVKEEEEIFNPSPFSTTMKPW